MNYSQKGWQWITLENVLHTLETGKRPKGGVLHQDSGVLSISAEHMTPSGGIDTSIGRFVPVDFYQAMKKGKVQPGDVLVVKDGATTGKTAYADNSLQGEPLAVNEHVFICRPNRDVINPRFLFYWLWSEEGWAQIRTCYQGSTIGGINRSFIQKVTVPLPPLCEQKRIATLLNEQMAYVEKARQAAEEMLEAAQALPGAFLRQVFPAHGDALPAGWKWTKLGKICEVILGQSPPSSTYRKIPEGLPFFQGKADFGDISPNPTTWCVEPKKVAEAGDVLISMRAPVGPTNIANTRCCIGRGLAAIRCRNEADRDFVLAGLKLYESDISGMGTGSLFNAITGKQLKEFVFPLPPLIEQKRIAALLKEQMAYVETVRMSAREQLDAINALPNALLRRAFAGNC